jgi:hypothetical protein
MKFKNYVSDIEKVRKMKVGLVKKIDEDTSKLIEKFELDMVETRNKIAEMNEILQYEYTGKRFFDICTREDISLDRLKVKRKDRLKEELLKAGDKLAKSQTQFEKRISEI